MSFMDKAGGVGNLIEGPDKLDKLDEALRDFRQSLHGWSESAYGRPRTVIPVGSRRVWRLATGWALGCVLLAGGASAGLWEHHRMEIQEMRIAAARLAEQQRLVAQEQARLEEEDLLAKVDSDVSREVPSAMEPLAQLMAADETK
jgi:hypothetical protein